MFKSATMRNIFATIAFGLIATVGTAASLLYVARQEMLEEGRDKIRHEAAAQAMQISMELRQASRFVEQLNAADTAAIEPMAHPLKDQVQRLRPDEVIDEDRHEKYQRNAARVEAGLYLVPKVIE